MKNPTVKTNLVNALINRFAIPVVKAAPVEIIEETPEIENNSVSPFALLFKEIRTDVIDEELDAALADPEFDEPKKKRGRPRKLNPDTLPGRHIMDFNRSVTTDKITPLVRNKMVDDFRKLYNEDELPLRSVLETLSKRYNIEYQQAHHALQSEF